MRYKVRFRLIIRIDLRNSIVKYAFAYFVLFFICSSSLTAQDIIEEQVEDGVVMSSGRNNSIRISFYATNLKYKKTIANNQEFFEVDIPGFQYSQEPGLPKLPVYASLIDLTGKDVVSIRIMGIKTERIFPEEKGMAGRFYPSQPSATKNQDPQELPFAINN